MGMKRSPYYDVTLRDVEQNFVPTDGIATSFVSSKKDRTLASHISTILDSLDNHDVCSI